MFKHFILTLLTTASIACAAPGDDSEFKGGYPSPETASKAYDDLDLTRALNAYRAFYPSVSGAAIFKGTLAAGAKLNERFGYMDTKPRHVGYTLNSDTPYGGVLLDLHSGPLVVEVPAGPLLGAGLDLHQGWIFDLGIPGPDAGKGGKYLLLPPGFQGGIPPGYYAGQSKSFRVVVGMRSLPSGGDVAGAIERIKSIRVHPLNPSAGWQTPSWFDMTPTPQDTTPGAWENNLQFWKELHEIVNTEPPVDHLRFAYGDLAALGIAKGKSFEPDERMRGILEKAAREGSAQMRVVSFADRRPDRVVWPDRKWQWASLRYENGSFDIPDYTDTHAREKWFYQAIAASPAMFKRDPSAGSLYWLGMQDSDGNYLNGGKAYKLTVPLPVPDRLFWSVTVYDAETRSQIQTEQGQAALRSLFELKDLSGSSVDLHFAPAPPAGHEKHWIRTTPGKGWFVYFRIYGPQPPAFDGSWKPGDFTEVK